MERHNNDPETARAGMIEHYIPKEYKCRLDADDDDRETSKHGGGNTKLPYGLCEEFGISLPDKATPEQAWKALEGKGIIPSDVFKSLEVYGTVKNYVSEMKGKTTGKTAKISDKLKESISTNPGRRLTEEQGDELTGNLKQFATDCGISESDISKAIEQADAGAKGEEEKYKNRRRVAAVIHALKEGGKTDDEIADGLGVDKKIVSYYGLPLAMERGRSLYWKLKSETMPVDDILNSPLIVELQNDYIAQGKKQKESGQPKPHNDFSPEREKIRHDIVDKIADTPPMKWDAQKKRFVKGNNDSVKKEHMATIVIGPPAAGKSSTCVNAISAYMGARIIDPDDVKEMLPEYNGGEGAGVVHLESSMVAKKYILGIGNDDAPFGKDGSHNGENIVYPTVGDDYGKVESMIAAMEHSGYTVNLVLNEAPPKIFLARAMSRAIETGRFINTGYLTGIGNLPSQTYSKMEKNNRCESFVRINSGSGSPKVTGQHMKDGQPIPQNLIWFSQYTQKKDK